MPDIPGDTSTSSTITVGSTVANSLEIVGDHDWFRIELTAGQRIDISVHGLSLYDSTLGVRSASGALLDFNDDYYFYDYDSFIAFSAPSAGTYYIDVGAYADGNTGTYELTVLGVSPFSAQSLALGAFGYNAGGWTSDDRYPREMADVNGDGQADIVGFGDGGVYVSLSQSGTTAFAAPVLVSNEFGAAPSSGGWASSNIFPRQLADINGDHRADIVAFGNAGVYVALGQAGGTFAPATLALHEFGSGASAGGWANNDIFTRLMGDVNGDGRADIVGFGNAGVYVALGQAGGGFSASAFVLPEFGYGAAAGGWQSDNIYPRLLGDVNGDNRADIIAFGEAGTYVALGQLGGGFAASILAIPEFGHGAGGWSSNSVYPRLVGDINGDHFDDIIGFGNAGVYYALGHGNGTFDAARFAIDQFGLSAAAGGWSSDNLFPRRVADVNGDGYDDVVGFYGDGVHVAYSNVDFWP